MGTKRVLPGYQVIPNPGNANTGAPAVLGVMTGTTVIISNPTNIQNLDNIGVQISWTGTAVGVIEIDCSIDGTNYFALSFGPALTQPAGTAGGYLVNLTELPYPLIRVKYTNASGTGTLSVWICGKDLN